MSTREDDKATLGKMFAGAVGGFIAMGFGFTNASSELLISVGVLGMMVFALCGLGVLVNLGAVLFPSSEREPLHQSRPVVRSYIADRPVGPDWERQRQVILVRDGNTCQQCGAYSPSGMHVDHVVPLSRGGHPLSRNNLQVLCERCNMSKGTGIKSWTTNAPGQYHDGRVL